MALLKLGKITDRKAFTEAGEEKLAPVRQSAGAIPQAVPTCSRRLISHWRNPNAQLSPATRPKPKTRALLNAVHLVYQPNKVVLGDAARSSICQNVACEKWPRGLSLHRHRVPAADERGGEGQGLLK